MIQRIVGILVLLLALGMWPKAGSAQTKPVEPESIPDEISRCLRGQHELTINGEINPFYLSGDFDGDGLMDFAIQVKVVTSDQKGILVCFAKRKPALIGAGGPTPWPKDEDNPWPFDSWIVVPRGSKLLSIYPYVKHDAFILSIGEEGGALVYWDGTKLNWKQQE
jgi:hypothetical protein